MLALKAEQIFCIAFGVYILYKDSRPRGKILYTISFLKKTLINNNNSNINTS